MLSKFVYDPIKTKGTPTCLLQEGRKKVYTLWDDGRERVEEFDIMTDDLLVRRWRRDHKRQVNVQDTGEGWEYEIGEPPRRALALTETVLENVNNPVFFRKDTAADFVWRVRNITYPKATYDISADAKEQKIVIRTSNRKYFKKFDIPDLVRRGLPLDPAQLSWAHENYTLVITYKKPEVVIQDDKQAQKERAALKPSKPGDASQCAQQ
eukprot:TRINITY_DN15671_c0_g1_i1.p1 TRINITY_DN15671_c0_g1~~TRINITY_DN15671_c0_g1_i1.p1  ORF type:complete len:209 (-),score=37.68 TRINITY_DN15671_c0_g1_i1:316-942(-)